MKNILLLLAGLSLGWAFSSCEYNNEETLYPMGPCDTAQVTYTLTIAPIIAQHCLDSDCHGGDASVSGIQLEGYINVKTQVETQRLLGAIRHEDGFSFMPKNTQALSACEILKFELWVADGAPDN